MYPIYPRSGIPTALTVSPRTAVVAAGGTLQLTPTLTDPNGNTIAPSQPFIYQVSNPELLTASANGLCTAASVGRGGQVEITVSYAWANSSISTIRASVLVTVTVQ